ncbi:MAG: serine protease [Planctomycetota bacterium]
MRRPLLCLAATMLMVWIGFRLSADEPRATQPIVQEASIAEPAMKPPVLRKSKKRERHGQVAAKALPYPVFGIDEVLDHLSKVGAKLHKAGKTKGDVELRRQLDRKTCELTLPTATDEPIADCDLYLRACESVFIVCSLYKSESDWQTSLATAFALTEDGVLSTSCHVFDNEDTADAIVVMDARKNVYPVTELLAANKLTDTCLFRIDAQNLKPLPLAEDAVPGAHVRVVAHPGDSFYYFSSGHVANYERDGDSVTWMNVTADFGQGSSGGPVFNEHGHVIGQVSRTFTLYAGGSETRGQPRRVAGDTKHADKKQAEKKAADEELMDPQMVFKSCVPVQGIRALVKPKQ